MKTIGGHNWKVLNGDCRDALPLLEPGSVHCVVTSPPYFGLRDYGVDGQMGLEPTPDEFVAEVVGVFRHVRDVLRDDGTVWLNLGDTYARDPKKGDRSEFMGLHKNLMGSGVHKASQRRQLGGLKPKDLIGIPWRVAFALQADGWYLRQDIIWHKPNPMPESVRDRCTKAHEYIFLLTKSARYFYDAEAVKEPAAFAGQQRGGSTNRYEQNAAGMDNREYDTRNKRSVWTVGTEPYPGAHFATFPPSLIAPCILAGCPEGGTVLDPFTGSGTTASVALGLGRQFVGCELNPEYLPLIEQRADDPWRPGVNGKREKPNPRWQSLFPDDV